MATPYRPGQSVYLTAPVAFADLPFVRSWQIKTHWDVSALIMATDAEWHPDLDAAKELRDRKLAKLPEIAVVLGDVYNAFKRLQGATERLRMLRRDLAACGPDTVPSFRASRVEQVAEQARYRADVAKRALAIRREREVLRGRGYGAADLMAAE